MLLQKKRIRSLKTLRYISNASIETSIELQKENNRWIKRKAFKRPALIMPDTFFRMRHWKKKLGHCGRYRCSLRIDAFTKTCSLPKATPRHFASPLNRVHEPAVLTDKKR